MWLLCGVVEYDSTSSSSIVGRIGRKVARQWKVHEKWDIYSTRSIVPNPLLISRGHSLPLSFSSGTPTTAPKTISFSNARKIRWIFELDFMPTHPAKNEMTNAGSTERQQGNVAAPRQQINTIYCLGVIINSITTCNARIHSLEQEDAFMREEALTERKRNRYEPTIDGMHRR